MVLKNRLSQTIREAEGVYGSYMVLKTIEESTVYQPPSREYATIGNTMGHPVTSSLSSGNHNLADRDRPMIEKKRKRP
jgi:hypothetical protein